MAAGEGRDEAAPNVPEARPRGRGRVAERTLAAEERSARRRATEPLLSAPYLLVLLAHFLSYANRMMLDPVWPLYLLSLGHSPTIIGLTLFSFSAASFATRPFLGQAVDRWSPRGVNVLGALASSAAALSYLLASLPLLVAGRALHGFGWAAINTAGATIASESTPASRRGEAIGYLNMMPSLGTALLPALGLWLVSGAGFPSVFALAGAFTLLAATASALIRERPRAHEARAQGNFWGRLLEPRVALPAALLMLVNCSYIILTVFVVLVARARGIQDLALYFLASGMAMVLGSGLNRLSDRWGRQPIVAACFGLVIAGMGLMFAAASLPALIAGGVVASLGVGLVHPALMALAIDLAPASRRGAALATYTAAFQIGTGGASLAWGAVIEWWGFPPMFVGAIGLSALGLALLAANWRTTAQPGTPGRHP